MTVDPSLIEGLAPGQDIEMKARKLNACQAGVAGFRIVFASDFFTEA